jgi:Zn-dependent peptidase ImmA (M78 family)
LEFKRGFKADANRIALRVRDRMGLEVNDPIEPEAVCAHYEIRLIPLSEVDPNSPFLVDTASFSAVTVPCAAETAIVHNDAHHPHRQHSNICHELAHCFLGHKCTPPLMDDGTRKHDVGIEAEANFLAGTLLIPNEAAVYIVREGLVARAGSIYGVSPAMLAYRLRVSGAHRIHERWMKTVRPAAN